MAGDRPSVEEILIATGAEAANNGGRTVVPGIIGRDVELAALERSLRHVRAGRAVIARVRGESGIGKSALCGAFVRRASERHDVLVLEGRCYEQESVPYKALDGIVDAMRQFLKRLPGAEVDALLPRDPHAAARLFPVLDRVDAIARAPRRDTEYTDLVAQRRAGFKALRELLERIADRRTTVIYIDDVQWGGADSANALSDMLRSPDAPAVLLVVAYRPEGDAYPFLKVFDAQFTTGARVETVDVDVAPLAADAAVMLASSLLTGDSAAKATLVARESAGNPFFIAELVRDLLSGTGDGDSSLASMVASRVVRLDRGARRLVEIVVVAGQPVAIEAAYRAARVEGRGAEVFREAANFHLIRETDIGGTRSYECYRSHPGNDRPNVAARRRVRARHADLAHALESIGDSPETLAIHFERAGLIEQAVEYAKRAGDEAARALAFDQAARLYRSVLAHVPEADRDRRRFVLTRLGDALALGGRGYEAAHVYITADALAAGTVADLCRAGRATRPRSAPARRSVRGDFAVVTDTFATPRRR